MEKGIQIAKIEEEKAHQNKQIKERIEKKWKTQYAQVYAAKGEKEKAVEALREVIEVNRSVIHQYVKGRSETRRRSKD